MIKVVLFTETNSSFGSKFFEIILNHPNIEISAVVTRAPGVLCSYYIHDKNEVDNATLAKKHNIPVLTPRSTKDPQFIAALKALDSDYFIVANYQLKIPFEVLKIPKYDSINFHPSPLPRYAGLAPFYWMWANKETVGGVSAIIMDESLDTGDIIAQHLFRLDPSMNVEEIRELTFRRSWQLLKLVLPTLVDHSYIGIKQDLRSRSYYRQPQGKIRT